MGRGAQEQNTRWVYRLSKASMDASVERASLDSLDPDKAALLVGVDGQLEGGLRPSSGWARVHELGGPPGAGGLIDSDPDVDSTSVAVDVFSFQVYEDDTHYVYGFVWRYTHKRSGGGIPTTANVYVDFRRVDTAAGTSTLTTGYKVLSSVSAVAPMSVSVWGRMVYVFIRGRDPIGLRWEAGSPVVTDPLGPLKQPTITDSKKMLVLGGLTPPSDPDVPGVGGVFLTESLPSQVGLGLGTETKDGQGDDGQTDDDVHAWEPGDYSYAFQLHDTRTGRWSSISEVGQTRQEEFTLTISSGSLSGTSLPPTSLYAALEIVYDYTRYDRAYIYRSVKVQDAGGTFVAAILHLDKIIRLDRYHTSNNASPPFSGSNYRQAVYWFELEDKQLVFQPTYIDQPLFDETVPQGGASVMYDGTLLVADLVTSSRSAEDEDREGDAFNGLAEVRWSAMSLAAPELFPPANRYVPAQVTSNVVGFAEAGPNVVALAGDEMYFCRKESIYMSVVPAHRGYGPINNKAFATVGSAVYFLTDRGLRMVDASGRLDFVKGVDQVVQVLWSNELSHSTTSGFPKISVAYDAAAACLFLVNRERHETLAMWFTTGRISMFRDTPFWLAFEGVWPSTYTSSTAALERRAFVVQNVPDYWTEAQGPLTGSGAFAPRLFVYDYKREKRRPNGEQRIALLDLTGDNSLRYTVQTATPLNLSGLGGYDVTLDRTVAGYPEGAYVYVVNPSDGDKAREYQKAQVSYDAGVTQLRLFVPDRFYDADGEGKVPTTEWVIKDGDEIVLSPMPVEWIGTPLSLTPADGIRYGVEADFFRVKRVDGMTCLATDVEGEPVGTTHARFVGAIYMGESSTTAARGSPSDNSGATVESLLNNNPSKYVGFEDATSPLRGAHGVQGSLVSPAVRIITADLDYRLVSVAVVGAVTGTFLTEVA